MTDTDESLFIEMLKTTFDPNQVLVVRLKPDLSTSEYHSIYTRARKAIEGLGIKSKVLFLSGVNIEQLDKRQAVRFAREILQHFGEEP